MLIEKIVDNVKEELPGFELVGYSEIGLPVFNRSLYCEVLSKQGISVVDEFVLRYYALNLTISEISEILGIDYSIVEEAWWSLIQDELVDYQSKKITELGQNYINDIKVERIETRVLKVSIDGLTGKITKQNPNLMGTKQLRSLGLNSLRPLFMIPDIESLNLTQIRRVYKAQQRLEEDQKDELLGVYNMEGRKTEYRRLMLFAYSNGSNIRYQVYSSLERLPEYEDALIELSQMGTSIMKPDCGGYFDGAKPALDCLLNIDREEELTSKETIDKWEELFNKAQHEITIILPLIEPCNPSQNLMFLLNKAIQRGITGSIIIAGRPFISEYQKNQYDNLIKNAKKAGFTLTNIPEYLNKTLIIDKKEAIIADFRKSELINEDFGLVEYSYYLSNIADYPFLYDRIDFKKPAKQVGRDVNKKWVRNQIEVIIQLAYTLDEQITVQNGIGWFGVGSIPQIENVLSIPLASDEASFKLFVTAMNLSFVEIIHDVGKANGLKAYFWNEFKNLNNSLQRVLDRIRVYRNSVSHLKLDQANQRKYFEFLDEDLAGALPQLVDNGFMILQELILRLLEKEIRLAIRDI